MLVWPYGWLYAGWVGVDLFFVLSGFLITGILYDSRGNPHRARNFYVRRTLRIFPLYWGFFLLVYLLRQPLHLYYLRSIWFFAAYIGNLTLPVIAFQRHSPTIINVLGLRTPFSLRIDHFWSLCVEEQFYLIWPMIVWFAGSRRALLKVCLSGFFATALLRTGLYVFASQHYIDTSLYIATYTRCDSLLAGAWLAVWLRDEQVTAARARRVAHSFVWPSLTILLAGWALTGRRWPNGFSNPFIATAGYDLLALLFAGLLLWSIDESSPLAKALIRSRLGLLGLVSYGFYIFHELLEPVFREQFLPPFAKLHLGAVAFSLAFLFLWLAAWVSFRFYESPFLRLKDRLAPTDHRSTPAGTEERHVLGIGA